MNSQPKRISEEADDYPKVIVASDRWRVIQCRNGIQWLLQFTAGERHGQKRWQSRSFYRPVMR